MLLIYKQKIIQLVPSDPLVLEYCAELLKLNDHVTLIDCMFDTLDYSQWKNDLVRWSFLEKILLNVKRYFYFLDATLEPKLIIISIN